MTQIPKIVHHMWMQGFEYAPVKKDIIIQRTWGSNVQHLFWDEKSILNLIKTKYSEWLLFFIKIQVLIIKCDIARAFILHYYGGVYADLDIIPTKNHESVFRTTDERIIVPSQHLFNTFLSFPNNNWMACKPNNIWWIESFLPHAQKYLKEGGSFVDAFLMSIFSNYHVFATAGPIVYYTAARKNTMNIKQLNLNDSVKLFEHPPFKSSWINYKFLNKKIIVFIIQIFIIYLAMKVSLYKKNVFA